MPSIVKRGNSYRIFVSLGSDGGGKAVRKSTTYHPPKGTNDKKARFLAEQYAFEYEDQCRSSHDFSNATKLGDLCKWYFEVIAPVAVKERTAINNQHLMDNYILPILGKTRLRDITPCKLDTLFSGLLVIGGPKGGKPLKTGTVVLIRMVLSTIFETAVKKGITDVNPVKLSIRPREDKTERSYLDETSCRLLLEKLNEMPSQQAARAVKILLYTGLRRGELLALTWEDIDFKKKEIHVNSTVCRCQGQVIVTTPKTKSSIRVIPVSKEVIELFREQKQYCREQRKARRKPWIRTNACFINRHGDYLNGEYLNNTFRNFLVSKGFPPMHLHDLRHANASLLINKGVPMKIVSEHLGHQSIRTTETFYTHLFSDSQKITAKVITETLTK